MTEIRYKKYFRPAVWGFFICVISVIILRVIIFLLPSIVPSKTVEGLGENRIEMEQIIQFEFQKHIDGLNSIIKRVLSDPVLFPNIEHMKDVALKDLFAKLNSFDIQDNQTLELVDSTGNVIAWEGFSVSSNYAEIVGRNIAQQNIHVIQNGFRTYLVVAKKITGTEYFLIASELIELNSPISNRFIHKFSINDELTQKLNAKVKLRSSESVKLNQNEVLLSIKDDSGKRLVEFIIGIKSSSTKSAQINNSIANISNIILMFAALFAAILSCIWISGKNQRWLTIITVIISLWIVRIIWRLIDMPAGIIGGWLFSPNLYGSPFLFGLSSSVGEIIITAAVVLISSWLIFIHRIFENEKDQESKLSKYISGNKSIIILIIVAGVFIILWLVRGYGEAIRSFVFDSTIRYANPSEILPAETASVMHLVILVLGASLFFLSLALLLPSVKLLADRLGSSILILRITLISIGSVCLVIFYMIDETSIELLLIMIFFMASISVLIGLKNKWDTEKVDIFSQKLRFAIWIVCLSFLFGMTILHQKIQLKQNREVEKLANEILRPTDSWLTYIVLDGLRSVTSIMSEDINSKEIESSKNNNMAFVLWTKTLLGREGYNSALIFYDRNGNETDRFIVGVNKPEIQEALTNVFESEEDAITVIKQYPSKTDQLYGAWTTFRSSSGQLIGSAAILLAENQRAIFRGEETEPLQQYQNPFDRDIILEIAIHEYQSDTLIYSTGEKMYPDKILPITIDEELKKTKGQSLWKNLTINGHNNHTVFIYDVSNPERIVAISIEEADIRWALFNYLKELIICLIAMALIGIYVMIKQNSHGTLSIGFRGKLIIGFTLLTLFPLAVLSYYNRQLVTEKVNEQVEKRLIKELQQLHDRINAYVSDEDDFIQGIDDDFCEALASEYGIDFSIYRNTSIQASSRPELYRATLLDERLNGNVFSSVVLGDKNDLLIKEKIGSVEYLVGYTPISISGKIAGVLSIPTLNRQREIEKEMAQQNAYVFGAYAIVFGIVLVLGTVLSMRFAMPIQKLTQGAKDISDGNLDVNIIVKSNDEIGTLAKTFNNMVAKLKANMIELAKQEREIAWKEMAKQVAHEIKNPLTPIKLSVQHLRQAFKDKAVDREEILQRVTQTVIEQIDALSKIATEFSNFAKMPETKFERIDIGRLIKETVNLYCEVDRINFIEKYSEAQIMVIADRDQLRGVFTNIIRNAIQAINGTGDITIETCQQKHNCVIKISDTGDGIPAEILKKIFMPNFSTKTEGMGLGLAIAHRVIEDHGGTISCSSQPGKVTTFEIRLPA
jgi:two-component system, NtrC family, nitrogen regulation sensor histidine kinase NtrY